MKRLCGFFPSNKMSCESEILCGVCLDSLDSNNPSSTVLTCHHWFHDACVEPWLASKGTCPTCRMRLRDVEDEEDETLQILRDIHTMREILMEFWERRGFQHAELNLEDVARHVQEERETLEAQRQAHTGIRLEEYASHVRIVNETDDTWMYEIDGQAGQSLKNDISLVQTQTDAGFLTCIYATYRYENDIVSAIMDITGCM